MIYNKMEDVDIKNELKELRLKVKDLGVLDFNNISYSDLIEFIFKAIRRIDKRLDVLESKV